MSRCTTPLSLSLSLFHQFILFLPSASSSHAFFNNERKGFASSSSSVLRSKLQYRRRRSITSGPEWIGRSERAKAPTREGGRVQNPLGNQSSTALQSLRQSLPPSVGRWLQRRESDEQELVKKRKRIRTRFDAAAEAATRKRCGKTRIPYFHSIHTRGQQVKPREFNDSGLHFRIRRIVSHHIGKIIIRGSNMGINNDDGEFEVHANINTNVTVGGRTQDSGEKL